MTNETTILCPQCGDRPVQEFIYAHEETQYFTLTSGPDGTIVGTLDEIGDTYEDRRVFHECGDYVDDVPDVVLP